MAIKAWNAAYLGTAFLLAGTDYFGPLISILGGGAAGNLIVLAGARNARE